jgi:hypothetical protein
MTGVWGSKDVRTVENLGHCDINPRPWVCLGDFNEVLHLDEHIGIGHRSMTLVNGFREVVDTSRLLDLGYTGRSWTYEKMVAGGTYCRVRLDRALADTDLMSMFPSAIVS